MSGPTWEWLTSRHTLFLPHSAWLWPPPQAVTPALRNGGASRLQRPLPVLCLKSEILGTTLWSAEILLLLLPYLWVVLDEEIKLGVNLGEMESGESAADFRVGETSHD